MLHLCPSCFCCSQPLSPAQSTQTQSSSSCMLNSVSSSGTLLFLRLLFVFFFFQAEDGIRDIGVTGVQTCALPISRVAIRRAPCPGSVRSLSRAAAAQPLAIYVFLRARGYHRGGILAGSAREMPRRTSTIAPHCRLAAARRRRGARCGAGSRTAGRSERECRARDAGGSRAQRFWARGGRGLRVSRSLPCDRALQPCDAYRERRGEPPAIGARRIRPVRRNLSRGYAGGRSQGTRHGADR